MYILNMLYSLIVPICNYYCLLSKFIALISKIFNNMLI